MRRGTGAGLVGVFIVFALVAMAGCGGDDSVTKAEFVKEADAICKKGIAAKNTSLEAGLRQMAKGGNKDPFATPAAQEELIEKHAIPPFSTMAAELEDLDVPSENGEEATKIVDEIASKVKAIENDPSLAIEATSPFAQVDSRAAKYGLKECSQL